MSLERFIFHHPTAYQRILAGCLLCMLSAGLWTTAAAHMGAGINSQSSERSFGLELPQQTVTKTARLSRLPGKDGSANPPAPSPVSQPTPVVAAALTVNGDIRSLGREMNAVTFGDSQWPALDHLWTRESNWNPSSHNAYSGACGIPQALPCSKIPDMSPQGQIAWGLAYIQHRYGTPANAWAHSQAYGWY